MGYLAAGIFVGIALCAWLGAEFSTTLKDHPKIPQVAIGLAAVALFFTIRFSAKVIRKARGTTHTYSVALDELEPFKKLAAAGQLDRALKDDDVAIRNLTFEIFSKIPNRVQVSLDIENLTKEPIVIHGVIVEWTKNSNQPIADAICVLPSERTVGPEVSAIVRTFEMTQTMFNSNVAAGTVVILTFTHHRTYWKSLRKSVVDARVVLND